MASNPETILVTGGDGYLGWPTARALAARTDAEVVVADNFTRRQCTEAVGGGSVVPIGTPGDRFGREGITHRGTDLAKRDATKRLLADTEPDAVVHCAAQPSAPYAQLDGNRALFTQTNNVGATVNLLWGLRENDLTDTHVVATTTTGLYGAPPFPIPEGSLAVGPLAGLDDGAGCVEVAEHRADADATATLPYPNCGGSWYHVTKGLDAANLRLAADQWGQPVSEVRTSIVYGVETPETTTRLDVDAHFGTVVHRFCAQAAAELPVTVYGAGEQDKPFVGLRDAVAGLVALATADDADGHAVYNQVTETTSIVDLAQTVVQTARASGLDTRVEHVENPREEDEHHDMTIDNARYLDYIGWQDETLGGAVQRLLGRLEDNRDRLADYVDALAPEGGESA